MVDDLQQFVERTNFPHLFIGAKEKGVVLIAICRSRGEVEKVWRRLTEKGIEFDDLFPFE